ncbi:response regulator [Paenibacillus antri]|uniref:Response regulator n=1 Tax=Paenibacillus antri TaxID=2582848 RepID=A0A5R9G796_9BACL|nr:response regulator [Paenibacillus antri]TLS50949.1 response regulator [Paenibacillus antri]
MRALIVDDEKHTRDSLRQYVPWSDMGVDTVETAKNGLEALGLAQRCLPDLLLTDIRMPKMNGIELASKIRGMSADCQIIFLSGYADKEYLKEAIHLKAVSYIEKPIDVKEIAAVLLKAIAESGDRQAARMAAAIQFYGNIERQSDRARNVDADVYARFRHALHADDRDTAIAWVRELADAAGSMQDADTQRVKFMFFQLLRIIDDIAKDQGIAPNPENDEPHLAWQRVEAAGTLAELFRHVLDDVDRLFRAKEEKDSVGRKMYEITRYIRENYADPTFSTQSIADYANFSHTYLCTFFKKNSGKTVGDYITEVRMDKAKELLKEGRLKLYEIADRLGYKDANYFTTLFKKHTGCTPTQYMEKYYL